MTWFLFPAQAGVILSITGISNWFVGIPRASGGDPNQKLFLFLGLKYSPRKRG